jgi:hypothetical protein
MTGTFSHQLSDPCMQHHIQLNMGQMTNISNRSGTEFPRLVEVKEPFGWQKVPRNQNVAVVSLEAINGIVMHGQLFSNYKL